MTNRIDQNHPTLSFLIELYEPLLARRPWTMLISTVLIGLLMAALNLPIVHAGVISIFIPFNPLMGLSGFNGNRPTLADLDNDGDLDILVGGALFGDLEYLPNIGSNSSPAFAPPIINPFGLISEGGFLNRAPVLADLDNDGDLDLLIGDQEGSLNYYKNIGSASSPVFASPIVNPFGLTDIGDVSTPTLGDLDKDGDLDLLAGAQDGNLRYFQNSGSASSPVFAIPLTNPFGLTDVGSFGWSAPNLADLDNDGDLDVLVGENTGNLYYFQNTGSVSSPAFAPPVINPFGLVGVGSFSAPTLADLDNDGDLDALIGETDSLYYFSNSGSANSPAFVPPNFTPFGLDSVGAQSAPALPDLDNDGDLDALVGNSLGRFYYFQNIGSVSNPLFAAPLTNPFGLVNTISGGSTPALADLDNDGDLDLLTGDNFGSLHYFQNIGSASNPLFAAPLINPFGLVLLSSSFSKPALADLNNDGDLDALVGASDGNLYYFQNVGNASSPAFAFPVLNPFGLADVDTFSAPTLIDFDNDGDLDVLVGRGDGSMLYFHNIGSASSPAFATPVLNPSGLADVGSWSIPILADLDNDDDLDALVGRYDGYIIYFERQQLVADYSTYLPNVQRNN
jgi:hypothetical protein